MRKLVKRIVPEIPDHQFLVGDCLELMRQMPDNSVDLVLCSPPYEDARLYGELNFKVKGQDWVDWAKERYLECVRVSKGLVAWVIEGKTRNFQWSATPALLMADLHRAGVKLRKPPAYFRVGIPGSGGPDWFRNDYEFVVCSSKGKLPWSNNTACGHTPKWAPGGAMSHRITDGSRVNQWGHPINSGATVVESGGVVRSKGKRPSHVQVSGDGYDPPAKANPGTVIQETYTAQEVAEMLALESDMMWTKVGGGLMGHKLAHENEAPYAESWVERMLLSFCPEGGTVLDPFSGSGTTVCVAKKYGRKGIGIDLRQDQIDISLKRIADPVYERKVS